MSTCPYHLKIAWKFLKTAELPQYQKKTHLADTSGFLSWNVFLINRHSEMEGNQVSILLCEIRSLS